MAIELTPEQQSVVDNRGGNLLVSAAAGSGKTRVLVERLMKYVEQGEGIDRFLVITFTNAAAAELRQRIAGAIHDRLAQNPGDHNLRRASSAVYKASICTIDSFCIDFLRQWGHLVDLDPDFRLCDQAEGDELRTQALQEVLENRYRNIANDSGFEALVDALAGERSDQTLETVILDMHHRVQAQADPRKWLLDRRSDFDLSGKNGPEDTPWGRLLLEDGKELVEHWLGELEILRCEVNSDALLEQNYAPSLESTLAWLEQYRDALSEGWDSAAACSSPVFPDLGRKRGEHDEALKERVKAGRDRCKDQMKKLAQRFELTAAQAMEDLNAIAPSMIALLEVTEEFDRAFEAMKRRHRLIDFADAEHLTARLLSDENGEPTRLALEVGAGFAEIMVDEYQDTNGVQNVIFDALSRGDNLFFVGDVKQSIYRFRLADPTIFLEKYDRFLLHEEAKKGDERKILLSSNFRSRPEVLDGVNFIFKNVMTRAAGELDYTDAEALRAGRKEPLPDQRYSVELDCVDLSTDDEDSGRDKDEIMAWAAAERIQSLLESGLPIGDRPLRPEDIVILLRSPGPVLRYYADALNGLGIPWSAEGGYEFFGTTEISVAISLLHVIDNPRQDVPLLAVLRSPLYNFTPDRLAELRGGSRGCIYDALKAGRDRGEQDCVDFLIQLEELRDMAAEEASHTLLWHIYNTADLPAVFAAMPEGERRRANLMALYDEACRFEGSGHRGLMAFLLHLTRMAENGVNVPVAAGEGMGGVRILSIHRSKGLEFPVVLLCGMERRFNESDLQNTILFHPDLGLGPMRTDRSRMLRYTTIARDAVAVRLRRQLRAEEMRLLYVAMTRAEHKLIMMTAVNGRMNGLKSIAAQAQCPPSSRQMAEASSMAEWVLTPALCREDSNALWANLSSERPMPACGDYGWDIRLINVNEHDGDDAEAVEQEEHKQVLSVPDDLEQQFSWQYPWQAAVDIHSKLTATQLKGRNKDLQVAEEGVEAPPVHAAVPLRAPCFVGERELTPAQRGTALHMVMQYLDFKCTESHEEIADEIARLVAQQYITPQQGAAVDPELILAVFRSELGQRILAAKQLQREFKFMLLVPAADYYPEAKELDDEVLLQGVVDCWFEEEDGTITVVDFKTDRVSPATVQARAEEYRSQLAVYTRALGEVVGRTVGKRYLWFFAIGDAVEIC